MKKRDDDNSIDESTFDMKLRTRPTTNVTLKIPKDVSASLEKVAASRDMSTDALLKSYIGHGLRQDLAKLFTDRVMEKTAEVLTRHLQSEAEVSAILDEIRLESVD